MNRNRLSRTVLVVGLVLTVTGIVLGMIPLTAMAPDVVTPSTQLVQVECGPVFEMPIGAHVADSVMACDQVLGSRAPWVWTLVGLGVTILLGRFMMRAAGGQARPPTGKGEGYDV
jgi:hypothetical protein